MARVGGNGRDDGMKVPGLAEPNEPFDGSQDDLVSRGWPHDQSRNPVARKGRPDGMVAPGLTDLDGPGTLADQDDMPAGGWPHGDSRNTTNRIRPEVEGQLLRGFVHQEPSSGLNPPTITDADVNPGGAIKPV